MHSRLGVMTSLRSIKVITESRGLIFGPLELGQLHMIAMCQGTRHAYARAALPSSNAAS